MSNRLVFFRRFFELVRLNGDGLSLVFFDERLFIVIHGFSEALDRVAEVGAQALEALGAEQHHHDHQNDQELPDANATQSHDVYSVVSGWMAAWVAAPFDPVVCRPCIVTGIPAGVYRCGRFIPGRRSAEWRLRTQRQHNAIHIYLQT